MHPFKQDQQNENIHLHKNIIEHKRKMAVQFFFFIQIGKLIRKMLVQSRGIPKWIFKKQSNFYFYEGRIENVHVKLLKQRSQILGGKQKLPELRK